MKRHTASNVCVSLRQNLHDSPADSATGKAYPTDITSYEDTKKVIDEIARDFNGRLDIFVANAGIPWTQGGMIDGELSHYNKVVATDLDSVFYCAKAAGKIFRSQYESGGVNMMGEKMQNYSYGSFIATASMSGHIANIPQLQAAVSAVLSSTSCRFLNLLTFRSTTQQRQA